MPGTLLTSISIPQGLLKVSGDELQQLKFPEKIKYHFIKSFREDTDLKVNTFVKDKINQIDFDEETTLEQKKDFLQKQISHLSLNQFDRTAILSVPFYNDLKVQVITKISSTEAVSETDIVYWENLAEGQIADWAGVNCKINRFGTSGSYRVRNLAGTTIGIFKPLSESPHADNNPHWKVRIRNKAQKTLGFTDRCTDESVGHKCEELASRFNDIFQWNLVPQARVACFSSDSLQLKDFQVGSFQVYIDKAHDGYVHFNIPGWVSPALSKYFLPDTIKNTEKKLSRESFERFALLQYLICNTDGNLGNMLFTKSSTDAKAIDAWFSMPHKNPASWLDKRGLHLWDSLPWAEEVISKEAVQCVFDNKDELIAEVDRLLPGRDDIKSLFLERINALECARDGLKWIDLARADLNLQKFPLPLTT